MVGGYISVLFLGKITHIADGINGYKCLGVDFADIVHQQPILIFIHNGHHFHPGSSVVGTDDFVPCGTAVQVMQQLLDNGIQML